MVRYKLPKEALCRKLNYHFSSVPASELRSCVKVEVAVLNSPFLTALMVSVDVKQHGTGYIYSFIQLLQPLLQTVEL